MEKSSLTHIIVDPVKIKKERDIIFDIPNVKYLVWLRRASAMVVVLGGQMMAWD